jgi:DNA-directed RNA polymerase subunit L/DNA-directed RNA polymerase alpha subunit
MASFQDIQSVSEKKLQFTLEPTSYPYANTLRRAMMTLVPMVAFRSDPAGQVLENSDIKVGQNDSNTQPNELLAHRISLIPIHNADALKWDPDRYVFKIDLTNERPDPRDVMAADIQVFERRKAADLSEILVEIPGREFFKVNTLTRDTCLITTLPGKRQPSVTPTLKVEMRATVGTGREHARFIPTSQASYGYTLDTSTERRNEYFEKWLVRHKNVQPESLKQDETRRGELDREFKTMEIQRVFRVDEKGEPNSFDFQLESIGTMAPRAIVERALIGLIDMCNQFIGLDSGDLPSTINAVPSDALMTGFDFVIQGQDHTFGNMIQTWLVDNHVEGEALPRLTFAGYKIPHPLKDEMLLRVGVEDGNELTVRAAIAEAAKGCRAMFEEWLRQWTGGTRSAGATSAAAPATAAAGKKSIKLKRTTVDPTTSAATATGTGK